MERLNERLVMAVVLIGGLGLNCGLVLMSGAGKVYGSTSFNSCMGHTRHFEVSFISGEFKPELDMKGTRLA